MMGRWYLLENIFLWEQLHTDIHQCIFIPALRLACTVIVCILENETALGSYGDRVQRTMTLMERLASLRGR